MIRCENGIVEIEGTGIDLLADLAMAIEAISEAGDIQKEAILSLVKLMLAMKNGEEGEEEDGEEQDSVQEERSGKTLGDIMSKFSRGRKRTYRRG